MTQQFIYGYQPVKGILTHQPKLVRRLYLQHSREDQRAYELQERAEQANIAVVWKTRDELDRLIGNTQHQGMAIECEKIIGLTEAYLDDLLVESSHPLLFLLLDGIQDPHNLGACIRTANAMGVDAVIIPKDRAASLNETVHKVACGATATTPVIQVTNLARLMRHLKTHGISLIGMDATASLNLPEIKINFPIALVMGGEGQGLRRLTRKHCDYLVRIPMHGSVASLNVSVATAIGLYVIKQQQSKPLRGPI